jgi:hypothetical protein
MARRGDGIYAARPGATSPTKASATSRAWGRGSTGRSPAEARHDRAEED